MKQIVILFFYFFLPHKLFRQKRVRGTSNVLDGLQSSLHGQLQSLSISVQCQSQEGNPSA